MTWPCFMLQVTEQAERSLRRFTFQADVACPLSTWGHDASVAIDDAPVVRTREGYYSALSWPHEDPRWPTHCACGYAFQSTDRWKCDQQPIFTGAPDGATCTLRNPPTGAMWDAVWLHGSYETADGQVLIVKLPDGHEWLVDGPSTNGNGWTRTGTPPLITARPSILSPGYHGWLTDGVLSDDLDGRTYP